MDYPANRPPASSEEEARRKNALVISLITGVLFLVITVILTPVAYYENGLAGLWGILITGIASAAAFTSALQVSRGRATQGIGILIAALLILSCMLPFLAYGQGLGLAIIILVLVSGISSIALPPMLARRAIVSAFIITVLVILVDLYLPRASLPNDPTYTNILAGAISVVYAFFILRNFRSYTLQTKIVIAFILITIVPLIALSVINSRYSTAALQRQSEAQLSALANIAADTLDDFINAQTDAIHADAKQISLIEYLEPPSQPGEEKNASQALLFLSRKNPVFIRSIAVLDSNGMDVLDTFEDYTGRDESMFTHFTRPMKSGLPYVSNITFRGKKPSIYFSAPIKNLDGETIGVLRIEYYGTIIQSIVRSLDTGGNDTIISVVDVNTYLRTGYTGERDNLFKTYRDFSEVEFVALQSDGRLPANAIMATDDAIVAGMDNLAQEPFFYSYSELHQSEAINAGVFLKNLPWAVLVQQPTETYLASIREQNKTNTLTSMLLVVFGILAGFVASQILTSPLGILTKVAEKITSGDLNAQAEVNTKDEIGILADTFNRMTRQLSQTLTGLEQRVAERTADLELSRQQSIRRANELQSIGEISKIITSEQKLENLLPLITRLVSERFDFYHVGIFLVDNSNQYAVLQASNSAGGQNMLKRGHKLELGENSIVGYVARSGYPRISLDVGQDAVYFNNPDLPETRSEIALPLKVRDSLVGVLDVQSKRAGAFTENDASTLGILADQIAIALENARLFAQTQQALNEAQALYRQNIQEGWKVFSRQKGFVGYRQNITSGQKITRAVKSDEIEQTMKRGEVLIFHADGITQEASIVLPIKLRGQVIGSINIKAPIKNREWSADEINLAETVCERLSIALDNARLIEEAQRQAAREQTLGDITGKISEAANLKNVLRTAVEELGRIMPGSNVVLQLKNSNESKESQG